MKRDQRESYLLLTRIDLPDPFGGYLGLCHMCRHARWTGSSCDADSDLECKCGIYDMEERSFDVWSGSDCWAFKPLYAHEDCVDMVGVLLQGEWADMDGCTRLGTNK